MDSNSISSNEDILAILRKKGAPDLCHLISSYHELDGIEIPLDEALNKLKCYGVGTLVGCIPGRLGFYYGEDGEERIILERNAK